MKKPNKNDFYQLSEILQKPIEDGLDYLPYPELGELRRFFIKKGNNYNKHMELIQGNHSYQWLINQNSEEWKYNNGVKKGYNSAVVRAFGVPNKNRWGEEWATRMSHWILSNALGVVENYWGYCPSNLRKITYLEIITKVKKQSVDPWLDFFIVCISDYMYPIFTIKEIKAEHKAQRKKYSKTMRLIDKLLADISSDGYSELINLGAAPKLTLTEHAETLMLLKARVRSSYAYTIFADRKYGPANDSAPEREFISNTWGWLYSAGLGSKESVILNLLSMPEISPHRLTAKAVENSIRQLKQNIDGFDSFFPIGFEPFGLALDNEFQLRMMDTSLYPN